MPVGESSWGGAPAWDPGAWVRVQLLLARRVAESKLPTWALPAGVGGGVGTALGPLVSPWNTCFTSEVTNPDRQSGYKAASVTSVESRSPRVVSPSFSTHISHPKVVPRGLGDPRPWCPIPPGGAERKDPGVRYTSSRPPHPTLSPHGPSAGPQPSPPAGPPLLARPQVSVSVHPTQTTEKSVTSGTPLILSTPTMSPPCLWSPPAF